jgi:hypothetical protein
LRHLWIVYWIAGFAGNLLLLAYSLGPIVKVSVGDVILSGLLFLSALLSLHFLARAVSRKHLEYLRRTRRIVLATTVASPLILLLGCFDSGIVSFLELALVAVFVLIATATWQAIASRIALR